MNDPWPVLELILAAIGELRDSVHELHRKADRIMAAQDDINAAVAAVQALLADLQAQTAQIATDLGEIQSSGTVDTSALNGVVGQVAAVQSALDAGVANLTAAVTPPAG